MGYGGIILIPRSPHGEPNIIRLVKSRRMKWADRAGRMGEMRNAYSILIEKPEGKRPLGRPRRRWEHNVRMD
jgi:hypothetical protein